MKTDRRDEPAIAASVAPRAAGSGSLQRRRFERVLAGLAVFIVLLGTLVFGRHVIAGWLVPRGLALATGDQVSVGSVVLGVHQSVLRDVHVMTPAGDPLLDAAQVAVGYSLHDLIWGGRHRFGITRLDVVRPVLTIVRHADGTYNLRGRAPGGGAPVATAAQTPLTFSAHISDGTLRLVDRAPVAADLRAQEVMGIFVSAQVASDGQSRARGHAMLVGRQTENAAVRSWPIAVDALSDVRRGIGLLRAHAALLPLRGPIGFVQHSTAIRVDAGLLQHVNVAVFALNLGLNEPFDMHVGGNADLRDGRLAVAALRAPVRELHGRLTLTDDGVWSKGLAGTLAGLPLEARGGAFHRLAPELRLGLRAQGDLTALRSMFAFSRTQPVSGRAQVQTLIEAPVSNILIRSALRAAHVRYGSIPLDDISGRVDYHASTVVLDAVSGRYGVAKVTLGGRFLLGPNLDAAVTVAGRGPGRLLPYAQNVAPEGDVDALAVISGGQRYEAHAAIGVRGNGVDGNALIAVDKQGVGEFGPFAFVRDDGSSLVGALRLERPTSQSAAWLSARGYRIAVPSRASELPGLTIPAFPPVAGRLDATIVGGGAPGHFGLAGSITGVALRVGSANLGTGRARIGGTLRDVRLSDIALDGPLGRFGGDAGVSDGTFALRGQYAGSFERLVPLTGRQSAHGALRGPILATLVGNDVVVQSAGAQLRGASIRGVELEAASGTLAVRAKTFHLVAADASIGGRRMVARESNGTVAVSAPDLPSQALRGTGLPLDGGNLSVYGVADLRKARPDFDGTVAIANGRARGYRITADARIDVDGSRARIFAATGALGSTYGSIGGSVDGIGERALRYDLATRVPLGDIDLLRRDLRLPVRNLAGSFAANLHLYGSGNLPFIDGTFEAPEGIYNGLAFRNAAARLVIDAGGVAARSGRLTVGTTDATISAGTSGGGFTLAVKAAQADLADFDDYFDTGETLAGRGRFDVLFQTSGGRVVTHGALALRALRYRAFPLGDTRADWHMNGATIVARATVAGGAGSLAATGRIAPAAGGNDLVRIFRNARYDVSGRFDRLDLGTWLPAAGFSQPVLGNVDARFELTGRQPRLGLGVDATVSDASVAGYPVARAHLRATSLGTRIKVTAGSADLGFAQVSGTGSFGLGDRDPLAFDLRATTDDVKQAIRAFVPAAHGLDIGGALDADIRFAGSRAKPVVEGGFDLTDARYGTFAIPRAIGALALAGRAIELRDADVEFTRGQAFVAGSLPLVLQPFGLGPSRAALSFDVTARGVDLAQFQPLFATGTKLGGTVDGRFGVEGSVDRPRLFGALAIANGSYLSTFERAPIQHVDAALNFAGRSVELRTFHAGVGGGTLDAGGHISLPLGASERTTYALDVRAHAAQLDFPAFGRGTLDGSLRLTSEAAQPLLAGDISLRDAVIPAGAVYGSSSAAGGTGARGFPIDPALAIRASAANNVRIRNSILDIGVTGAVDLSGDLLAPKLAGAFTATDGTVSSYNHVFRLVNASATFDPADGILPTVAARATARVSNPDPDPSRNIAGSANITVTVSGTPDSNNLQVAYSSDPPYSQEQIVGLLFDVPGLLGALNFNLNGGAGATLLRGAPGETNALLPPGVTPEQVSAISFNQEVFSLLNGQFTQRALNPIERVFEKVFGLSDLEFTVDYGGGLGYSLRRQIGKRDFYAFLSQTVTYPERSNFGFELEPKPFEALKFSYYQQNGVTSLITNQTQSAPFSLGSTRRLTSVQPLGNRSGFSLDFNRRF